MPMPRYLPIRRGIIENIMALVSLKRPENVISKHLNLSAHSVRNWPYRGIPPLHWEAVANLAGIPVEKVRRAHKKQERKKRP